MIRVVAGLSMWLFVVAASAAPGPPMAATEPAYGGYCPVAYVEMGKAVSGHEEFAVDHAGQHILLANADAKRMYQAHPDKYRVAYDGYCATAMAMGKRVASDPTLFAVVDGTTYLFSSADARRAFDAEPAGSIGKADAEWSHLKPAYGGYCPVAYIKMGKAVPGNEATSVDHAGRHVLLANAKAKGMYQAHPEKYRVAYDGYCATAMAMGKKVDSDPTLFEVVQGVTYLFSSAEAKTMFDADRSGKIEMADSQWAQLSD